MGEISKEFVDIAMSRNRLCDFQQSLVSLPQSLAGRCGMPIHGRSVWPIGPQRLKGDGAMERPPLSAFQLRIHRDGRIE